MVLWFFVLWSFACQASKGRRTRLTGIIVSTAPSPVAIKVSATLWALQSEVADHKGEGGMSPCLGTGSKMHVYPKIFNTFRDRKRVNFNWGRSCV